jgi:hypothetical protein
MEKGKLAYFDGKEVHVGKICAHCLFFYASKRAFTSEKDGNCTRCKDCYPELCLCLSTIVKPTGVCKHWSVRSDAHKIKCEEELPNDHEKKNDGNYFIS